MTFTKMHEGAGEYRGVEFEFTILQTDGEAFSELNYTLPNGPAVDVVGGVPFPTMEQAIKAVHQSAALAIDAWMAKRNP